MFSLANKSRMASQLLRQTLLSSPSSGSGSVSAASRRSLSDENDAYSSPNEAGQRHEKCLNQVTLLGRVGVNPQLRGTEKHPVVSFSLATNVNYRPGGAGSTQEFVTKTDWHNVAVFRPYLRDTVHQHVTKGQRVLVTGRIMYGSVEDDMGTIRHTATIVAEDVIRFA